MVNTICRSLLLALLLTLLNTSLIHAAAPVGFLDIATTSHIGGWAGDPDSPHTQVSVDVYVNNIKVQTLVANGKSSKAICQQISGAGNSECDICDQSNINITNHPQCFHQYNWNPHSFGANQTHSVSTRVIGVDAQGNPDGQVAVTGGSPKNLTEPRIHSLTSPDGTVTVEVDAVYGGIISSIIDHVNMPGVNQLVTHGGAGLQSAFWLLPMHTQVPPGCDPNRDDMWYHNPTQGGYYADVSAGNPIGIRGTQANAFDPNEFIEIVNGRLRFKSKMIRHDFCASPNATLDLVHLWDTDFYLEQEIYFDNRYSNALRVDSKITSVASADKLVDTRQLPISFTNNLNRVMYEHNGQLHVRESLPNSDLFTDKTWMAAIRNSTQSGHGFVFSPTLNTFRWSGFNNGLFEYAPSSDNVPRLFLDRHGHPLLRTFGVTSNVTRLNDGAHWHFHPGGSFSWTFYIPVGNASHIRTVSNNIYSTGFPDAVDFNNDSKVNIFDYNFYVKNVSNFISPINIRGLLMGRFGK